MVDPVMQGLEDWLDYQDELEIQAEREQEEKEEGRVTGDDDDE